MKKLLFFLCFFVSIHSFGQHDWTEGTLYLKNGTVKKGLIKFPQISKDLIAFNGKQKVKFKVNKKATQEKYDHNTVTKIEFVNSDENIDIYEYVPVTKRKYQLFKRIVSGKATLYGRIVTQTDRTHIPGRIMPVHVNIENYDEFYVIREGEKIASPLITTKIFSSFRRKAMKYFADCPRLVEKLKNKSYTEKNIEHIVVVYNNCKVIK